MAQVLDYATPVTERAARLDSLDLLRGVAILGILLMNTQSTGLPSAAYYGPTGYLPDDNLHGPNFAAYVFTHIFADMKFITIFSMMFGAGILLQGERVAARGMSAAAVHYRRMAVLLFIGLIHAYLIWMGDVLVEYSLCGMMLFPLRKLPPAVLVLMGVSFIAMYSVIDYADFQGYGGPFQMMRDLSERLTAGIAGNPEELSAYRLGGRAEMINRFWLSFNNQTTGFLGFTFWRCGGAMLIGMALQRARFFHGEWPRQAYGILAAFAIPVGWIITGIGVLANIQYNFDWKLDPTDILTSSDTFTPGQFNYWGSLMAAIGYLSLGVMVAFWAADQRHRIIRLMVIPIRAVGRTALSNYILQSLIDTTIFYGHGLGYFGYVNRVGLLLITLEIWAFQLIASTIYIRYFRQGPLEYLWHKAVYFTYGFQPLQPAAA